MILIHKRVEELAKQADEDLLENVQEENRSSWAQVFAELIVEESIKVMKENDYHGGWLGEKIKKHFGEEE